jgi:hypothetical protein
LKKRSAGLPILARHVLAVPGAARQAVPQFWHEYRRCRLVPPAARRRRQINALKSIGTVGGKGFHEIYDPAAHLHVGDLDEGAVELKPFRTAAEFDCESHRRILGKSAIARGLLTRGILEKESDRHAEDGGYCLQAAGADAIRALFILLDLLKRDAEILTQLFLAHSEHIAAKPDATSDMDVDRIRFLLVFFYHFFLAEFFRLFLFFLPK